MYREILNEDLNGLMSSTEDKYLRRVKTCKAKFNESTVASWIKL